jgi:hypothetical protein
VDEDQMTILVVGDSFMSNEQYRYQGKHWTELISNHTIMNYSLPGASNNWILHHLFRALHKTTPTAVVIGFTDPNRIEFKNTLDDSDLQYRLPYGPPQWITNCYEPWLTSDQKLATTLWKITTDSDFNSARDAMNIVNMLYFVKSTGIPFVFTFGMFKYNMGPCVPDYTKKHLEKFSKYQLHTNLADVPVTEYDNECCFHLPQPKYQVAMADEVLAHLTRVGWSG